MSPSQGKLSQLTKFNLILSICLAIITPGLSELRPDFIEIKPFSHPPGIYFEYIGQMGMATDSWNIVVYYNLDPYIKEAYNLSNQFKKLKTICVSLTSYKEYCMVIVAQFQQQLTVIETNNEILMKSHGHYTSSRVRRSPFDFIGSIANKAFGILDHEYANNMADTISKIETNEEYLLQLIKNQTSIIDSTENIMRKDRQFVDKNFALISKYLEDLQEEVKGTNKQIEDRKIFDGFTLLSTHVTLLMIRYQRIQSALIEVVTDCRNGKINPLVLTPDQLKQELNLIRENLPTPLILPGQNDPSELLQLYSLMTAKTRVTATNIIFHIKLPLLTKEPFEIFKVVPVPIKTNNTLIEIQTSSEYLAVSLHRDQYYELSSEELAACFTTIREQYICTQKHVLFHKGSGHSQCELHILNQEGILTKDCQFKKTSKSKVWIQLHDRNSWIYVLDHSYVLNIVCGTTTFQKTLEGQGLLRFKETCVIKQDSITISSHHVYSSRIESSFVPSITIQPEELNAHLEQQGAATNPEKLITRNHSYMIEHLKESIQTIKQQQQLPQTISSTDIHQFSISYLAIILGIITIFIYVIRRYIKNRKTAKVTSNNDPPQRPSRRIDFQLKTKREERQFEGLQPFNAGEYVQSHS